MKYLILSSNKVLSDCSLKLIQLLISYENKQLRGIDEKIDAIQTTIGQHPPNNDHEKIFANLNTNLERLENTIMALKKNKFDCDVMVYKINRVYVL